MSGSKVESIEVVMEVAKIHKPSVSFTQVMDDPMEEELLGKQYIPKATLRMLGFTGEENLKITLSLA